MKRYIIIPAFLSLLFFVQGCLRPISPTTPVWPTPTQTPSITLTGTPSSTSTLPVTLTMTPTATPTLTITYTPTFTPTGTATYTPTFTPTLSISPTTTVPSGPCTNSSGFTCTPTPNLTLIPTATSTQTLTATPSLTVTSTVTATCTATGTIAVSCSAQTILSFTGNLNSAQQANQPGGVLQLGTDMTAVLPLMITNSINTLVGSISPYQSGNALFQKADFTQTVDLSPLALPNHAFPLMDSGDSLDGVRSIPATCYAWGQGGTLPPACSVTKTVIDSLGATRKIEFLFYQVNDLGTASPPVNAGAPATQAAWAWYAFEVTGGLQPAVSNLIEGTGVFEGYDAATSGFSFPRCTGDNYWGDFLFFNSDGSLASEGSVRSDVTGGPQAKPYLYLPLDGNYISSNPNNPQYVVGLNFGTAGMLGYGKTDGITGNAAPSIVY